MKMTGSSSSMLALSRPLASRGVAGATTLRPGTELNQFSNVWEWVAPSWPHPLTVRITMGTRILPPNM